MIDSSNGDQDNVDNNRVSQEEIQVFLESDKLNEIEKATIRDMSDYLKTKTLDEAMTQLE